MTVAAVLAATALGGCGLAVGLPVSSGGAADATTGATTDATTTLTSGTSTTSKLETSTAPRVETNELATPPGAQEHAPAVSSPQLALRRFASVYINWDAADVKRRLAELADDSVGQARTAMQLEAAQTGADPELSQAGIANQGKIEAVAPLAGSANRYVVITLETTTATDSSAYQGLAAAWHLTVATVARRSGGWVISGWQPQS